MAKRNPDRRPDHDLDPTRLPADTGLRPEYDVERAVSDYADWLRDTTAGWRSYPS